jgi:regulatory protein
MGSGSGLQYVEADMDAATAYDRVILLLAQRAHSRAELLRKLCQRGATAAVAREAVDRAAAQGYVDDLEYARMYARNGLDRGLAPLRIRQDLARRGVDPHTAETALAEEFAAVDVQDLALAVARRRAARLTGDSQSVRRRLAAYLQRRGFPTHVTLAAVDAVAPLG